MLSSSDVFVSLVRIVIETALNGLWQGVVLTTLVWCSLRVIKQMNAATRHMIWFVTLLLVSALPLLQLLRSAHENHLTGTITILSAEGGVAGAWANRAAAEETTLSQPHADSQNELHPAEHASSASAALTAITTGLPKNKTVTYFQVVCDPNAPVLKNEEDVFSGLTAMLMPGLPFRWSLTIVGIWFLFTLFFLLRIGRSFLRLKTLTKESRSLPALYQRYFEEAVAESLCRKDISVRSTPAVSMPLAVGFSQATVLLPEFLVRQLSSQEFRQISLHEIAHLMRRDDLTNLCAKLIKALFFFHPAVWWIDRQLTAEREIAADDFVLNVTGQQRSYAVCLARLLELQMVPIPELLGTGALLPRKQVFVRIKNIMDKKRNSSPRLLKARLIVPLCVSLIFFLCTFLLPAFAFPRATDERGQALTGTRCQLTTLSSSNEPVTSSED